MENNLGLRVNCIVESFNIHTGRIAQRTHCHNLVVNLGLDELIDNGLVNTDYIAIGTDNTAVTATDTELGVEVQRQASSNTDEGTGIREYDKTFTFSSGESYTITEAGLFDSAIASGSLMINRFVFSGHTVDVDNSVRVRITMTLTAV